VAGLCLREHLLGVTVGTVDVGMLDGFVKGSLCVANRIVGGYAPATGDSLGMLLVTVTRTSFATAREVTRSTHWITDTTQLEALNHKYFMFLHVCAIRLQVHAA
jgi:hypothetical protein